VVEAKTATNMARKMHNTADARMRNCGDNVKYFKQKQNKI
jgi:hypothetical protein